MRKTISKYRRIHKGRHGRLKKTEAIYDHIWPFMAIWPTGQKGQNIGKWGIPEKSYENLVEHGTWHMASMVSHDAKKKKINDHLIMTWVCFGEFAFVI